LKVLANVVSAEESWAVSSPLIVVVSPQRVGKVIRRGGAFQRNGARQLSFATRGQLEHLGAQNRLGLDRRFRAVAQHDGLADGEPNPDLGAV